MTRRKKGKPVHGWLVLDKPKGMTSTQAVGAAKRLFEAQKAGHAGTLDPLATGMLPIALGEATKTVPFAVDGEKSYRFTVRFGAETDTDDAEGKIVRTSELRPSRGEIEALLPQFTGEILQVPPRFSAIKVDGNRAYDLARSGEEVSLEPRTVVIEDLRLIDMPDAATAVFEAACGKGTYVRALARDMGRALRCFAHVIALRRTRVGPFEEAAAVGLEALQAAAEAGEDALGVHLLPVEAALEGLPGLGVGPGDAASLARGQAVLIRGRDAPVLTGAAYAHFKGRILALGELEKGEFRPRRVFNFG
jgi:tRNA pseudouridine55 synthase